MSETVQILLTRGYVATIDAEDFERVSKFKWHAAGTDWVYARTGRGPNGKAVPMHRLILNVEPGHQVDHINGNTLDNRRSNLRVVTNQQNRWNQRSWRNSASKFRGVTWDCHRGLWQAEITFDKRRQKLGRYKTEEDAAKAYDRIAWLCFGDFARLNFPRRARAS